MQSPIFPASDDQYRPVSVLRAGPGQYNQLYSTVCSVSQKGKSLEPRFLLHVTEQQRSAHTDLNSFQYEKNDGDGRYRRWELKGREEVPCQGRRGDGDLKRVYTGNFGTNESQWHREEVAFKSFSTRYRAATVVPL